MQWCSVLSQVPSAEAAASDVATRLQAALSGQCPDLIWVFVSPAFNGAYTSIQEILQNVFREAVVVGCSGNGVLADGTEVEHHAPALAAMAAVLPGVQLTVRHVETSEFPAAEDAEAWRRLVGVTTVPRPSFILLPDPFTCDVGPLLSGLDAAYPDSAKIGGLASGGQRPGDHALYAGQTCENRGAVIVAMQGALSMQTVVAQGCRPVGEPMLVTRCEENTVLELNQRRPVEILQDLAANLPKSIFSRHGFFLGIEMRDQREYKHGDFLVRNLLSVDRTSGGLIVGASIKPYQAVQFHVFDREAAVLDLGSQLERAASEDGNAEAALLFSCLGRGQGLFNEPDHDSNQLRTYLGAPSLAGFFCNGEIGPVGGKTFLHGYTSAIALFRPT
ncbi:MAG: FIST N-terminal domain-containing protein [Myxococcota bacterium]